MDMDILCTSGDLNDIRPREKEKVVPHYVNKASRVAVELEAQRGTRERKEEASCCFALFSLDKAPTQWFSRFPLQSRVSRRTEKS